MVVVVVVVYRLIMMGVINVWGVMFNNGQGVRFVCLACAPIKMDREGVVHVRVGAWFRVPVPYGVRG